MARKKKPEEHENHERWLVSYADFITLLFAFFVVMYSVSSVNEGKYRVLSNSLTTAFGKDSSNISPITLGKPAKPSLIASAIKSKTVFNMDIKKPIPGAKTDDEDGGGSGEGESLEDIAEEIEQGMKALIDDDLVKVGMGKNGVEVEINTSVLFQSGSSSLQNIAVPTLRKMAKILKGKPHSVHVEGFTDNVPINTEIFPSNWELSAARAASVVHLFMKYGVRPENMSAIGYGEYQPVASNTTAKGRMQNRRVVIVIAPQKQRREVQNDPTKLGGKPQTSPGVEKESN